MDFSAEFKKLFGQKPKLTIHSKVVENCDFADYVYRSKNVYVSYFLTETEDAYYSEHLFKARDCVDCAYLTSSELCYECIDCSNLYNCSYLQDCHNCSNVDYSIDCINCKDCFGCFGLRHKQFTLFNKTYPEDEYRKRITNFKKKPPRDILQILLPEFSKHPRLYARQLKGGERCFGDYIYFSKNCFQCYNVRNAENCAYFTDSMDSKLISFGNIDCSFSLDINNCYECDRVISCTNCMFATDSQGCHDSEYIVNCYNCKNCFGCVYLMNKEFCLLNRQFSREEYAVALKKIKDELKKQGKYGRSLAELGGLITMKL